MAGGTHSADRLDVQNGTGWVNELNADPRLRTPAGAGTQVIQNDQENLMQQAWSQLGDLLRANQKIRQLQLGLMSSFVMYEKNVVPLQADQSWRSRNWFRVESWEVR